MPLAPGRFWFIPCGATALALLLLLCLSKCFEFPVRRGKEKTISEPNKAISDNDSLPLKNKTPSTARTAGEALTHVALPLSERLADHIIAFKGANAYQATKLQNRLTEQLRKYSCNQFIEYFNAITPQQISDLTELITPNGLNLLTRIGGAYSSQAVKEEMLNPAEAIKNLDLRTVITGICAGREIAMVANGALETLKSLPSAVRQYAEPEVLLNAAHTYPQDTLHYILGNDCQMSMNKELALAMCSSYFLANPEFFSMQVSKSVPSRRRDYVVGFMVRSLASYDIPSAEAWLQEIESSEIKEAIIPTLTHYKQRLK
ncbi:MAG: hypothetical protein KA004_19205 [Verrucomicrobiales bacterium]|nr:hypothetical protein [Verrucomicrobiales bacterium]